MIMQYSLLLLDQNFMMDRQMCLLIGVVINITFSKMSTCGIKEEIQVKIQ